MSSKQVDYDVAFAVRILNQSGQAERVAKDILQQNSLLNKRPYRPTLRKIMSRLCKIFDVTIEEIKSPSRFAHIVLARQAVYYWTRRKTKLSSAQIGQLLGGRNHSTVYIGAAAYRRKRARDGRYLRDVKRSGK